MRLLLKTAVLVLVLSVCTGCTFGQPSDEQSIRSTIQRYNELLAEGYRALNMNGMVQVATPAQAESEYVHMSSLAEGDVRLDPTLKKLEVLSVSVEATSARAETRESWEYRHYSRKTGKLIFEEKGLVYHLAWDFERQPTGEWLVSDVRAISSTSTGEPSRPGTTAPPPPAKN